MSSRPTTVQKLGLQSDIRASRKYHRHRSTRQPWIKGFSLVLADVCAIAIAWKLAQFLNQFYSPIPHVFIWWTWLGLPSLFWLLVLATITTFAHYRLYSHSNAVQDYTKAAKLISYIYLGSLIVIYFYDPHLNLPRSLFLSAWLGSVLSIFCFRFLTNLWLTKLESWHRPATVFLIAPAHRLKTLSQIVDKQHNYLVVGAAIASTAHSATTWQSIMRLRPEEVLAEDIPEAELASSLFWQLRSIGVVLRLLPSSREMIYRRGMPEIFASLPTLRIESSFFRGADYQLKRGLDFLVAVTATILLSPLFLAIAVSIKVSSAGPIFFRQERTGLHGKLFYAWKFRTMVVNAPDLQASLEQQNEHTDGVMFKIASDPRITSIGKLLRRTSLDELPQLFNVLLGQMSIVGPRPLPIRDTLLFESWHHVRHQVLPGITGLWQVSGRANIKTFNDAIRLDLHYIDNWSLNLDLEILLETIKIVCLGKGAY
ncbi:exopolysaccharide biosynthesis polyprenyl glycosylphosphotransferase subfamily [Synechococcus sp. PCC 7335]|uniref:sugar transferase n=1 Tax=Synechococcus sp. (strain ATCC 29403 / PCC 7335) TaxID=91464 RepID=UPI00017EC78F|nr:sugar transferase [Synechococcus sp. PCC 7335]EDX83651.1 exopolysaccharide biosynthesis polyprenyl glycosylphosphotransferase subfamily [Synechococcus sp. PCC 7335]